MIGHIAAGELEARIFSGTICQHCGQPFKPVSRRQRYCTKQCKNNAAWVRFRAKLAAQGKDGHAKPRKAAK